MFRVITLFGTRARVKLYSGGFLVHFAYFTLADNIYLYIWCIGGMMTIRNYTVGFSWV